MEVWRLAPRKFLKFDVQIYRFWRILTAIKTSALADAQISHWVCTYITGSPGVKWGLNPTPTAAWPMKG